MDFEMRKMADFDTRPNGRHNCHKCLLLTNYYSLESDLLSFISLGKSERPTQTQSMDELYTIVFIKCIVVIYKSTDWFIHQNAPNNTEQFIYFTTESKQTAVFMRFYGVF